MLYYVAGLLYQVTNLLLGVKSCIRLVGAVSALSGEYEVSRSTVDPQFLEWDSTAFPDPCFPGVALSAWMLVTGWPAIFTASGLGTSQSSLTVIPSWEVDSQLGWMNQMLWQELSLLAVAQAAPGRKTELACRLLQWAMMKHCPVPRWSLQAFSPPRFNVESSPDCDSVHTSLQRGLIKHESSKFILPWRDSSGAGHTRASPLACQCPAGIWDV